MIARWTLRVLVALAALAAFAGMLLVLGVAALLWGGQRLWTRLTGRTAQPWSARLRPGRAGMKATTTAQRARAADVVDVQARDVSFRA